ncbi:hypothetical protein D3C71_1451020 [compost metagenome]
MDWPTRPAALVPWVTILELSRFSTTDPPVPPSPADAPMATEWKMPRLLALPPLPPPPPMDWATKPCALSPLVVSVRLVGVPITSPPEPPLPPVPPRLITPCVAPPAPPPPPMDCARTPIADSPVVVMVPDALMFTLLPLALSGFVSASPPSETPRPPALPAEPPLPPTDCARMPIAMVPLVPMVAVFVTEMTPDEPAAPPVPPLL